MANIRMSYHMRIFVIHHRKCSNDALARVEQTHLIPIIKHFTLGFVDLYTSQKEGID